MKKILPILLIISTLSAFSQQATVIDPNAVTVPRFVSATAVTAGIPSPVQGMFIYRNDTQSFWYYTTAGWTNLAASVSGTWATVGNNINNTNSGNVGVGTGTPATKLDVSHTGGTGLSVNSTANDSKININAQNGDAGLQFQKAGANQWTMRNRPADDYFEILENGGGGSRMVIQDGTGNVGISETNPSYRLDVLHGGSTGVRIRSSASFSVLDIDANSGDAALRFVKAGVNQWNIRNNPANDDFQFFELGGGGERMKIENTTGRVVMNGDVFVGNNFATTGNAVIGNNLSTNSFTLSTSAGAGKILTSDASGNGTWQSLTIPPPSQWTTVGSNIHYSSGNVGIGVATPNAPLQFASTIASRKVVLYDNNNNDHQFNGFGVNNGFIRYQVDQTAADHVFFSAINSTSSNELFRIKGNGNVGIGTSTPNAQLELAPTLANRKIVLHDLANNDNQFNGFGINPGIIRYQVGATAADHVFYAGANSTTSNELLRIKGNGNVGIGSTAPNSKLEVNGTIATKLVKINTFSNATLDETATVWYFSTNPNVAFPNANTCENRRYVLVNASGSVINLTSYYVGFDTFQKFDIPTNSSIEIISDGTNWLQIK